MRLDSERLGRTLRFASRVVLVVLCLVALNGSFRTARYWSSIAAFPGEVDFAEPIILFESNQLRAGVNIYGVDPGEQFIGAIYGPLLYVLNASVSGLVPDSFAPLRFLSLAAILLAALALGAIALLRSGNWVAGLLATLLALCPLGVVVFGATAKPDSVYLAFSLWGFAVALARPQSRWFYACVPLFVAAVFIKSSALAAPVAVFVVLLLRRDYRRALLLVLFCVGLSGLLLGLFGLRFGFRGLLTHLLTYNIAAFDAIGAFLVQPLTFVYVNLWFVLPAVAAAFLVRDRALVTYLAVACVLHLPLLGKAGGFINYWMEPSFALVLLVACGATFHLRPEQANDSARWRVLIRIAFVLAALGFVFGYSPRAFKKRPSKQSRNQALALHEQVASLFLKFRQERGRLPVVFAVNPGDVVRHRGAMRLLIVDPFLYKQHVALGRRDGSFLAAALRNREIDFVFLNGAADATLNPLLKDRIMPEHLDLLRKNFTVQKTIAGTEFSGGDVNVWVRRPGGP